VTNQQTASGADLARQAPAGYRANAKIAPTAKKKTRTMRPRRGDGRDPVGFGAVLARINAEQDWRLSLKGGSIIDQWPTLCPQFAEGTVQAVAFDAGRGRLDLRPASHAYAANLRLLGGQLCKQINDKLGQVVVRSIRVLPVGAIATTATEATDESAVPISTAVPAKTHETASPGYRHVLALHLEHKPAAPEDSPLVTAARARIDPAIAHPSRREPETAFADAVAETERVAADRNSGDADDVYQAALRMARAQKAGHAPVVRRLFDTA